MTLEAILISTLFLANLTVPPQALKPLGLHLVRNILRGTNYKQVSKRLEPQNAHYLQREAS